MNSTTGLGDLFGEATGAGAPHAPVSKSVSTISALVSESAEIDALLNKCLPALLRSTLDRDASARNAQRVDGRIIGTGAADFTKGNTLFTLHHQQKTFQLIDVPGIEGDELKYAHMVRAAVAKAHLVFYVNGTNKKPEKATAEKIQSYLRRGTQVCPVVNVRGSADAYEFEEDRIDLQKHGSAGAALKQTVDVLEAVLGKEVLLPGHCVQGLLAFSSLAVNSVQCTTSIHPSREHDLVVQQRSYTKRFSSSRASFDFSQIQELAEVLHAKLGTFKQDIIQSNKTKVVELLAEHLITLKAARAEHRIFLRRVEPEFEKCKEAVEGAVLTFERLTTTNRKNSWASFFNDLTEQADQIVADNYGENEHISSLIARAFRKRQDAMSTLLNEQTDEHVKALQDSMGDALKRLVEDVHRVEFQQKITFGEGERQAVYQSIDLDMDLGLKEWASIAFQIGSFAASGAALGAPGGPVGIAIGAGIGAIVGVLISVMHAFSSKEKRIRKAQAAVQEKISDIRAEVTKGLPKELKKFFLPLRKEIGETTVARIDAIQASLTEPLVIIERLIALMTNTKRQLEKMPYGTIQAIQR